MYRLMGRILQHPRLAGPKDQKWVTIGMGLWLFSPLTAVISTRGSGESLVTCLILGMLYELLNGRQCIPGAMLSVEDTSPIESQNRPCCLADRIVPAALCLGLAVHWRLYPIMYGLPILRFLAAQSRRQPRSVLNELCSQRGFLFGTVSGITFLALGLGCWSAYGHQFLEEAFLYHLKRTDPRHNFSPYFLSAYLASSSHLSSAYSIGRYALEELETCGFGYRLQLLDCTPFACRAFSFAQLVLTAVLGWTGNNNVVGAMFLQTIAFVTVNKVCERLRSLLYWIMS